MRTMLLVGLLLVACAGYAPVTVNMRGPAAPAAAVWPEFVDAPPPGARELALLESYGTCTRGAMAPAGQRIGATHLVQVPAMKPNVCQMRAFVVETPTSAAAPVP